MNNPIFGTSFDDVCTLIAKTIERGEKGEEIATESENEIFCGRLKINQNEFFKAQQEGLRSEICLLINTQEYNGEEYVKYNDKTYYIYRVYERDSDFLELYCGERTGV